MEVYNQYILLCSLVDLQKEKKIQEYKYSLRFLKTVVIWERNICVEKYLLPLIDEKETRNDSFMEEEIGKFKSFRAGEMLEITWKLRQPALVIQIYVRHFSHLPLSPLFFFSFLFLFHCSTPPILLCFLLPLK